MVILGKGYSDLIIWRWRQRSVTNHPDSILHLAMDRSGMVICLHTMFSQPCCNFLYTSPAAIKAIDGGSGDDGWTGGLSLGPGVAWHQYRCLWGSINDTIPPGLRWISVGLRLVIETPNKPMLPPWMTGRGFDPYAHISTHNVFLKNLFGHFDPKGVFIVC